MTRTALAALVAVTATATPASGDTFEAQKTPREPGIRALGTCAPSEKDAKKARFTLAHVNDLQARYSERLDGKSRYAYIAGYLRKLKKQNPATLVVDAGDDYEKGSIAELHSHGETTRRMVQAMPFDVRTIGNHDFAYGEAALLRDVRLSQHPVLASNLTWLGHAPEESPFASFVRINVGCVRVGVIGLVTQGFDAADRSTGAPYFGTFAQSVFYVDIANRIAEEHRAEVDVMIALTHIGLADDTILAARTTGIDLVVGAHSEDTLDHPGFVRHKDGSKAWIMQVGHFGEKVGRAEVVVDREDKSLAVTDYEVVPVDASLPVADDVDALAKSLDGDETHAVIARLDAPIKQGKEMSELLFRALRGDALFVGRDLFWAGLPRGEVTLQRLYDATLVQKEPSGTTGFSSLWTFDVTGAELARLKARFRPGWFYDAFLPSPIEPTKTYHVVLDKRAYAEAAVYFGGKVPKATFRGEMVDVLAKYLESGGR